MKLHLRHLVLLTGLLAAGVILMNTSCAEDRSTGEKMGMRKQTVRAPDFPDDAEWLNTDRPLSLRELQGKVVLLDFWTYCCINCIHILPDLKKLENKYEEELVVIGVHSAKFTTERGKENIRQAILRYNITHPVVNDPRLRIWQEYGARAWPTLVLIDPEGYVVKKHAGEGIFKPFDSAIADLISEYGNSIDRRPLDLTLEREKTAETFLKFPGKVTVDDKMDRLYITDSNNHRIVITDLGGKLIDIIGSGNPGIDDGNYDEAEFNQPQGTAISGNTLYIADTENHLIRKVHLQEKRVETVAGTGKQAYQPNDAGPAMKVSLNSPWDLTVVDRTLFIAMAGNHQLWRMDLQESYITAHAGSGRENILDGSLTKAQLAQPSGITSDGDYLYFADSEVSGIRKASVSANGKVTTLVGHGLFDYGDNDGALEHALLQHPLGVVHADDRLYLADTYNNKVKVIKPEEGTIQRYAGTGEAGMADGTRRNATFDEPGGIDFADGKIYIADTNNHLVRVIDTMTGEVSSLRVSGIGEKSMSQMTGGSQAPDSLVSPVNLGSAEQIKLTFRLPDGFKLNPLAESYVRLYAQSIDFRRTVKVTSGEMSIPVSFASAPDTLRAELVLYYCREENEGLCYIENLIYGIPNDSNGSENEIAIRHTISKSAGM